MATRGRAPGDGTRDSVALQPVGESVSAARRFVRTQLGRLGCQDLIETAELGVSELATNAILHARTEFIVSITRAKSGAVRILVKDFSPVPPQRRRNSRMTATGRGLRLVAVVGQWGVDQDADGTGKTVWFEPAARMDESAFYDPFELEAMRE